MMNFVKVVVVEWGLGDVCLQFVVGWENQVYWVFDVFGDYVLCFKCFGYWICIEIEFELQWMVVFD